MAPVKPSVYIFDPKSITRTRDRLHLTQKQMSEQLGVPVNTLSRWETGSTTPDANSLAAIHSLALKQGHTPGFFKKSPTAKTPTAQVPKGKANTGDRQHVIVMLDFQNLGVTAQNVHKLTTWIKGEIANRFPAATRTLLKAFVESNQQAAGDELGRLGWRVWKDVGDWDEDIIQRSKADCGKNPNQKALLLVTKDGDFASLAHHLRGKGVLVYVVGPQGTSQKLINSIDKGHWLQLPSSWGNVIMARSLI